MAEEVRLRCSGCATAERAGRILGRVRVESGRLTRRVRVDMSEPDESGNLARVERPTVTVERIPDGYRVECHPDCGAVFALPADELNRAVRLASDRGRRDVVAGVEVGRRLR